MADFFEENAGTWAKIPEFPQKGYDKSVTLLDESTVLVEGVQTWAFGDTLIRTVRVKSAPWFVGKDVSAALEYSKTQNLTDILDPDETAIATVPTSGGPQKMLIINEPGLYHAIFLSRKDAARGFRRWGTQEVLSALRKSGAYAVSVDAELELEKKRMEIARLKASRYVLDHMDDLRHDGLLTPRMMERLTGTPAAPRTDGRAVLLDRMREWLPRLVPAQDSFARLSDCRDDFSAFAGGEVTQALFTRMLKRLRPDVAISQRKLDGGNLPAQVISGYALEGGSPE